MSDKHSPGTHPVLQTEEMRKFQELLPEEYVDQRWNSEHVDFEVGPIEPDPKALADKSRRTIVRREREPNGKRFPFPVPNGWFAVEESRNLAAGDVQSLHVFGKDVVLYRSETGEARMIDAYCPHLGAHIGCGGKVDGDGIRCPFHAWRYDGETGRCTDIPYTKQERIPARAKVRTYPVVERNQMIWAWHHLEEEEPFYEVTEWPEFSDPEWLPYEIKTFELATCVQEMAENDADYVHFTYVHGSAPIEDGEQIVDGAYKRSANGIFVRENFGLGCTLLRLGDVFRFASSVVPIDEENVKVVWWFTGPRSSGEDAARIIAEAFFSGVSQDLRIWENKRYQPRPVLVKEEARIAEHRKWASQFYSGVSPETLAND